MTAIYILSLLRAAVRRRQISKRMNDLGLPFVFFDAIDGAEASESLEALQDDNLIRRNLGRKLSYSELACALSHKKIYRSIVDSGLPGALVLEDDCLPQPALREVIEALSSLSLPPRSVVHFDGDAFAQQGSILATYRLARRLNDFRLRQYVAGRQVYGTYAYYINSSAAESILRSERLVVHMADSWKSRYRFGAVPNLFLLSPSVVMHPSDSMDSEIAASRTLMQADQVNKPSIIRRAVIEFKEQIAFRLISRFI